MAPHTQKLMKELLMETKGCIPIDSSYRQDENIEQSASPNYFDVDNILGLDLEEIGDEVDDIFKSKARSGEDCVEESNKVRLMDDIKQQNVRSNPSPPKSKPADDSHSTLPAVKSWSQQAPMSKFSNHPEWELKAAMQDPSKALEKQLPAPMPAPKAVAGGSKSNTSTLWTPALDRWKTQETRLKMTYRGNGSDWEVETPFIGR